MEKLVPAKSISTRELNIGILGRVALKYRRHLTVTERNLTNLSPLYRFRNISSHAKAYKFVQLLPKRLIRCTGTDRNISNVLSRYEVWKAFL